MKFIINNIFQITATLILLLQCIFLEKYIKRSSRSVHFEYKIYNKQYKKLCAPLYFKICKLDSFYRFIKRFPDIKLSFDGIYLSKESINKLKQYVTDNAAATILETLENEIHEESLTFIKNEICALIKKKSCFASPELLKLSAEYEVLYEVRGICCNLNEMNEVFNKTKLHIVKEYNLCRKKLNIEYNKNELNTGNLEPIDDRQDEKSYTQSDH